MSNFATIQDMEVLWRPMTPAEEERAGELLTVVSDLLRDSAKRVGKDLDQMIEDGEITSSTAKSVTVDIVARALMTSTEGEPLTQSTESALGYSFTGTFLVPGGGLFIKRDELARLGLKRQKMGVIDLWAE